MEADAADTGHRLRIVSDAHPELLFHLGAAPLRYFPGTPTAFSQPNCLTGIFHRHVNIELLGPVRMYFVKLQPWAVPAVSGEKGSATINRQIDLNHFSADLAPTQSPDHDFAAWVRFAEGWIRDRIGEFCPDKVLIQAVNWILHENGSGAVGVLNGRFLVGQRRIEQLFREWIGVSPKTYARILRMRQVCQSIVEGRLRMGEIAYKHGFFDQSHFNREFKFFTDLTPRQYQQASQGKKLLYEVSS